MKPSFSFASPFGYQTPSSRSHRPAEMPKSKNPHDSRESSERLLRKQSRNSDEGRSSGKGSQPRSPSTSSLFSQQNVTLEDIPASTPPSQQVSPKMSTSRPGSTSRPAKSTARPPSQSLVRAVAQQATYQQPKVEEDVESVAPTPVPVKTPVPKPADKLKQSTASATATLPTAPLPTAPLPTAPEPTQLQGSPPPGPIAAETRTINGETVHSPLPSLSNKSSPTDTKSQPRRSFDDSLARPTYFPPATPAIPMAASAGSPPHSPRLHGYNPYSYPPGFMGPPPPSDSQRSSPAPPPPQMMPPMNYGYLPMMTGGPPPSMYGNPYYGMPFSPPAELMMPNNEITLSPSSNQDEHQQLLEKVAGVLPDINRLLNNYKETHGQLSAKEVLAKQADLSHSEELSRVRVELEATKKEYEKVIQNLVGEKSKLERELTGVRQRLTDLEMVEAESKALRTEVEALQANKRELMEGLEAIMRSKEEMQVNKLVKEKEIDSLKKALQAEKDLHHRNVADVKEQAKDQLDLKQKEFHKTIGDHKLNYSKVQVELTSLLSKHNGQKKELDAARSSEADHKIKLDLKGKEFEDALARHGQEIQSIKKKHEEEQERMAREGEERVAKLNEKHLIKDKEWQQELHDMGAELESEKAESQRLRDELGAAKRRTNAEKLERSAELVESLTLWRTKSDELQKENQNLDRILQGLGYATEMKSKGDVFFFEAFHQLAEQIIKVSRQCFVELPITPPKEKMLLIGADIPAFMDSTIAATEIRACYIQNTISSILHFRIFQPFLFTLGRRYGGVDTFLQSLSTDIRQKSERREAAWRQTTLRAAYTVSKAKEAINIVAAVIVDEIVDEIKHFAHQSHWPEITLGVQRIVKSAAEVWRFARIERELIKPFMPDVGAFDMPKCDWPEPEFEGAYEQQKPQERDKSQQRQVILCPLPHIVRESVHEGFLSEADKGAKDPCIYLQGTAIYSDSSIVLVRRQELRVSTEVGSLVDDASMDQEMDANFRG